MKNVTVVGVHHRRGDHLQYQLDHDIPHITMSYLGQSMDLFRRRFQENVVFLYISDDPEWIQPYAKKLKDLIPSSRKSKDRVEATGEDLALLSLCDHVIITHGTFSIWAAFLSKGNWIFPKHKGNNIVFSRSIHKAMHVPSHLKQI